MNRAWVQPLFRSYGISGIGVSGELRRGPLQALVNRYMEVYYPYFQDPRVFDCTAAEKLLAGIGISCPVFTGEVFRRCIDFALGCGWGEDLVI